MNNKTILLIIVIAVIIIGIVFLQSQNPSIENFNQTSLEKTIVSQKEGKYEYAKELQTPDGYLNIDNITISELIGKKVILVDFWTYSCINCQRTLPYLNSWYEKYKDSGLEIIGVHTPEFDFEKDYDNVKKAIGKYGIKYPVVQDNNYATWRAFGNHYWPRKYLIDIDGYIVYDHIGEGSYEETEREIQKVLEERNKKLNMNDTISSDISSPDAENPQFREIRTPEIYFGYGFSRNQMGNVENWSPGDAENYKFPEKLEEDKFYLMGEWLNNEDNMQSLSDAKIQIKYKAGYINLVAGSDSKTEIEIYIDNQYQKSIEISDYDLYLLHYDDSYSEHLLEIKLPEGLKVYTLTFG